jgi:hypothetical protein
MLLITTPVFGDLTPSITKQLPVVVRIAMGTTVFRIGIGLIFRRCVNLITPWRERLLVHSNRTAAGGQTEFPYGCGRVALRAQEEN